NLGPTHVGEAVAAAVETVTPAAEAKKIGIRVEREAGPPVITPDAGPLPQNGWKLPSNAGKFTPPGGRVRVSPYPGRATIRISVADSGEGIRAEILPIIFEPFQQADASTTRRHGGLGLGLAIVKQLAVAHGGSVSAASDGLGKGATFVVRLPARSVVPAVARS